MSIQSTVLNFFLKKFVKNTKPSPDEYSYQDMRDLMNDSFEMGEKNFIEKLIIKSTFANKRSSIKSTEIILDGIRTLKITRDDSQKEKCILYFHGGGYIAGSPETHLNLLKEIYNNSKITIYAIDYSLSPESKFPLALNEAVRSYAALRDLGYQANNIIIGGDSAGGNLSLVCTLKLQENNLELPSKLFLLSPWTDLTASGKSIESNSISDPYLSYDDFQLTKKSMKKVAETWYATGHNTTDKFISPLFAEYNNFPETLIQVSDIEVLLSDSVDLEKKMTSSNNNVVLSIYKNVPHVWQIFGFLPETKEAIKEIGNFINN